MKRSEGVYWSPLSTWRRQREAAELAALTPQKRGPKLDPHRAEWLHIAQLTREPDRLKSQLDKALLVIDVQKKSLQHCWATRSTRPATGGDGRAARAQPGSGRWRRLPSTGPASCRIGAASAQHRSWARRMAFVGPLPCRRPRPRPPLALDVKESQALLETLNSERFADTAPAAVHATLLDIEDARAHCQTFFAWYDTEHRHSGIGCMTPGSVHYAHAQALRDVRQAGLDVAFLASPTHFKGCRLQPAALPTAAWINPPPSEIANQKTKAPCAANS